MRSASFNRHHVIKECELELKTWYFAEAIMGHKAKKFGSEFG